MPGVEGNIMVEHIHRYKYANQFVRNLDVLDVACGEGYGSKLLSQSAKSVLGIDINQEIVNHAIRKYASDNLYFRCGSAQSLPVDSQSFDIVVSFETIEHIREHEKMISEIRRVLRQGGLLLISSPAKEIYSDARNFKNEFHVMELYSSDFLSLISKYFTHIVPLGQKLVYGSGIFPDNGPSEFLNFPSNAAGTRQGFADPLYRLALASNDGANVERRLGSFYEFDLYKSEAMSERFQLEGSLRVAFAKQEREAENLKAVVAQREREAAELRDALARQEREAESLKAVVAQREREAAELRDALARQERETESLKVVVAQREREAAELRDALDDRHRRAQASATALAELKSGSASLGGILSALTSKLTDLQHLNHGHRKHEARLELTTRELNDELSRLRHAAAGEIEALRRRSRAQEARIARLETVSGYLQTKIAALRKFGPLGSALLHGNGDPRGWVRALLSPTLSGRAPSGFARKLFFRGDRQARAPFDLIHSIVAGFDEVFHGYEPDAETEALLSEPLPPSGFAEPSGRSASEPNDEVAPTDLSRRDYKSWLRELKQDGLFSRVERYVVVATAHTRFVGLGLTSILESIGLKYDLTTEMPGAFGDNIYIVICPQMFSTLPPPERRVVFQMEQHISPWITAAYLSILAESLCVFDYSIDNIAFLQTRGIKTHQIYYVPISPIRLTEARADRDIDVLFYGAINSERRGRYLEALSGRFRLHRAVEVFGDDLSDLLRRAKVVVNIHFYESALLETTRISEAISFGAKVVSEKGADQPRHRIFEDDVRFVETGDVEGFLIEVEAALREPEAGDGTAVGRRFDTELWGMRMLFLRALHGIGLVTYAQFDEATRDVAFAAGRAVLCLPEASDRYFQSLDFERRDALLFPGLRAPEGWKGAALSYKYMAAKALRQGLRVLTVWEDDARLGAEFEARFATIMSYLEGLGDDWDIYSGLLSDLSDQAVIKSMANSDGEVLVRLDRVVGMVFGIYNASALRLISDFEILGDDTAKHTIDRYLEARHLNIFTTAEPLVAHDETRVSTIWSRDGKTYVANDEMEGMINASQARLYRKIIDYVGALG